jgi:N-acetylmuramoyl-L-alanine amidase
MRQKRWLHAAFAAACLMLASGNAMAGYRVRSVSCEGVTYLFVRELADYYKLSFSMSGDVCTLRSKTHSIRIERDKREATVDGVAVNLSYTPAAWQGALIISERDVRLLLDPILRPAALPRTNVRTIVLDPGHGGKDQGTDGQGRYLEKELCLRIARKTAALLRKQGYVVYMTRASDATLELEQRVAVAARVRGDLYVSLHMNTAGNRTVKGVETFVLAPYGTSSTYDNKVWKATRRGNQFDKSNSRLAFDLHKNVVEKTGAEDRGIKHANFLVLRDAPCAAALIEMGFLSNGAEEKKLGTTAYQDKVAQGLAGGIAAYAKAVEGMPAKGPVKVASAQTPAKESGERK